MTWKGIESEERKGIVHWPGTRVLFNVMFGHRTSASPRILGSNLAFQIVLKVYLSR